MSGWDWKKLKKDSKKETAISTNFTRRCVVGQVGNIIIHNIYIKEPTI